MKTNTNTNNNGQSVFEQGIAFEVAQNMEEALRCYTEAADAGHARAMYVIATCYEQGWCGLSKDKAEALKWCQKAADAGDKIAKFRLKRTLK